MTMKALKEKPEYEKNNILRRRYYTAAALAQDQLKKIRRWLDHGDHIEIATGDDHILITNQTAIQATPRSRELFGILDPASEMVLLNLKA
jgi:hypothetical protein